jgi:hypothetical protein
MIASPRHLVTPWRALAGAVLLALGALVSGCANMSDGMTSAFADPAKYDLYNCKQLEAERRSLTTKMAEMQGLIDKAQGGVGGPVVAEVAYRNEYIALRGQLKNADAAWAINKCRETPLSKAAETPAPPVAAPVRTNPSRAGSAIY